MIENHLGESSLRVTPIGLGLAALGRPGYITIGHGEDTPGDPVPELMREQSWEVLDRAWDRGVRYFDAARSYGRAEEFLAGWLQARSIDADNVTIGSKWGYTYTAGWRINLPEDQKHEVKEHTLPVLQRQIGESRHLLGNQLDLYQIHSATLESGVLEKRSVLEELGRLRDMGLLIGFSVSGPDQAQTILRGIEIEVGGSPLFGAVQATWNLLERSAGPALNDAAAAGLGVIVKEALANGRLTDRNRRPGFTSKRKLLEEQASKHETTIDALALAAAIARPWRSVVLSGAATVSHLESNLGALEIEWTPELERELAVLEEGSAGYWQTRSSLSWN